MSKAVAHPDSPHKYLRIKVKGRTSVSAYRWRCVKAGCHHYLLEDFIVGALAECHRCGCDFVIDKATKLMKPHCRKCTRRKDEASDEMLPAIEESPI